MSELQPRFPDLARGLLQADIITFGSHVLSSGAPSLFYINARRIISIPYLFDWACDAYADTLTESGLLVKPDGTKRFLAAVPEAVLYYGGAVGRQVEASLLQRRVKTKTHGQPQAVEGSYKQADELVLLDDVVTSANSIITEANRMSDAGLTVTGAVVLIDRQQGGRTELANHSINFAAAMTLSSIAHYALENRLAGMTQTLHDDVMGELDPYELAAV